MENIWMIVFRTFLVLIILFVLAKIMGKKQVSQLNLYDYIIGITIGSIAADISLDIEKDLLGGSLSLIIYGLSDYIISYITLKNINLRRFFSGIPNILIENNKIIEENLKKNKIDINDLLAEARTSGYFNLNEIDSAIMEINGKISFMPKTENKPVTRKDMKLKVKKETLVANVIIDSILLENNLKNMNKTKSWLDEELAKQLIYDYKDILLATLEENNKLTIYKKKITPKKESILE